MKRLWLPALALLVSSQAGAAVWKTTRSWTRADEVRFGEFINRLPFDFFQRTDHEFGGIPTDCADAAYTLRTIFAFRNGLPVTYTTFSGKITNETSAFDDVADPVKRVRKFIARVNNETNTKTLVKDSYPIAINRQSVIPGTMFLHPQGGSEVPVTYRAGHVYYVKDVPANGIVLYVSSTVPAAVRALNPRYGLIFSPMEDDGGYRAWIQPGTEERAGYSMEQFTMKKNGKQIWVPRTYGKGNSWFEWQQEIQRRLRTKAPTAKELERAQLANLTVAVNNRAADVLEGWKFYRANYAAGQCMNDDDYDAHSTPTRDVKVQIEFGHYRYAVKQLLISQGKATSAANLKAYFKTIVFEVIPGTRIDLDQMMTAFTSDKVVEISEPEHSPEVRWGLVPQGKWPCPERAKNYMNRQQAAEALRNGG